MPLTLPPAQNAVPAPVINSAPTSGLSPQALMMVRSAGVRLSDNALRTSGRLSVTMATRSRITHFNSVVPVSMMVSAIGDFLISIFAPSFRDGAKHRTSDVQLHIGESRDFGFDASHRPGMTMTSKTSPPTAAI